MFVDLDLLLVLRHEFDLPLAPPGQKKHEGYGIFIFSDLL